MVSSCKQCKFSHNSSHMARVIVSICYCYHHIHISIAWFSFEVAVLAWAMTLAAELFKDLEGVSFHFIPSTTSNQGRLQFIPDQWKARVGALVGVCWCVLVMMKVSQSQSRSLKHRTAGGLKCINPVEWGKNRRKQWPEDGKSRVLPLHPNAASNLLPYI